jgi:hypothetical protein
LGIVVVIVGQITAVGIVAVVGEVRMLVVLVEMWC